MKFSSQSIKEQAAEVLSQKYNIVAMVIFCISRFVCTLMLKYVNPGQLLKVLAIAASLCVLGVIFLQNIYGMYCLVGVSGRVLYGMIYPETGLLFFICEINLSFMQGN